ncbi:MAG: radical SAM protein [Deltaproteobacteria bacterium]|nr:radical SAM protein [Deltaproteobacteria bacterium]
MGSHSITQRHGRGEATARDAALQGSPYSAPLLPGGVPAAPRLVQWMATARCPLSCPHCLADAGPTADRRPPTAAPELGTDEALGLVDQVAKLGASEFLVTGGEPLARPDLPVVIEHMGRAALRWSLNTSAEPYGAVRAALERHPPAFVAVSVDGPPGVHDAFRGRCGALEESLRAIEFFAGLGSVVAAGTTVTRRNFGALPDTLALVARTRAAHWGLHLLVPEGRASRRPELFLRRPELRRLLRFVADKRRHYPVVMADELGWCGDWEPLLRDAPWRCGAGREQCVVLPDGEVVPCTTIDRSESAGNVRALSLAGIWRDGFPELREGRVAGACRRCEHLPSCGGGCWLLRRRGRGCQRVVWETPRTSAWSRAVSVVLAASLAASGASSDESAVPEDPAEAVTSETGAGLEAALVVWNTRGLPPSGFHDRWGGLPGDGGASVPDDGAVEIVPPPEMADDPGWRFFQDVAAGRLPRGLESCAAAIRDALETRERSLAFSALLFRSLAECTLDDRAPHRRTADERRALREALAKLDARTEAWRRAIYTERLDPYLARGREFTYYRFEMSKALIPPPNWLHLTRDVALERWGSAEQAAADDWLESHSWADQLVLTVTAESGTIDIAGSAAAGEGGATSLAATGVLVARVDAATGAEEGGDAGGGDDDGNGGASAHDVSCTVTSAAGDAWPVVLPAGVELTWADVVRLVYEQNREALDERATAIVENGWSWEDDASTPDPLLWPALRAHGNDPEVAPWIVDLWMF